ncbi:GW dipeptide domain-containing protein [Lentilactobacillus kefiri]|uniref:GW dipeptide domain-containing protein n=1 Tax=Lentilactobacillus kefiri TaxID=33962 RepID=UPI0035CF817D
MKISRIALASLISFGVFGGAGLNASASHHRGYHKVLWNKPMAHKQVALKNGKGIIWNKPFKTAKNAKIKYRISHGKSLALTTLRHMKVKGGSIYYFVKAGKFSGWINKKSVKLVKKTTVKTVTEPTRTTIPAPTTQAPQTTNSSGAQASSATSSNNGSGTATGSVPEPYKTDGYGTVTKTEDGKLPVDYNNPFSTYAEGTLKDDTWIYHHRYNGKRVYDRKVGFPLKKGAKVTVALNTPHSNRKTLLIKSETPDGTHYGYVKRSEVDFGTGNTSNQAANTTTPSPTSTSTPTPVAPDPMNYAITPLDVMLAANKKHTSVQPSGIDSDGKVTIVTSNDADNFRAGYQAAQNGVQNTIKDGDTPLKAMFKAADMGASVQAGNDSTFTKTDVANFNAGYQAAQTANATAQPQNSPTSNTGDVAPASGDNY